MRLSTYNFFVKFADVCNAFYQQTTFTTNTIKNCVKLTLCAAISLLPLASRAQDSGDEQGFDIPDNLQLPQDKEALQDALDGWWSEARGNFDERMSWYNDAKFGCFIHWGVYSVPAGIWKGRELGGYSERLMRRVTIPVKEYKEKLVETFNPQSLTPTNGCAT